MLELSREECAMQPEAIKALCDQQAAGADRQWETTGRIGQGLHFLREPVFAGVPEDARSRCVGAGTGAEMAHLARRCPGWRFMAVDPSGAMLGVRRRRAEQEGFIDRCV